MTGGHLMATELDLSEEWTLDGPLEEREWQDHVLESTPTAANLRAVQSALSAGVMRHSPSCCCLCWLDC